MDVARIEAGLVMLDVDYTPAPRAFTDAQASSPFELGLGWAVHLGKGNFVGKKALAEEKQRGSPLAFVGLEIDHVAFDRAHDRLGLTTPYPFTPWRGIGCVCTRPGGRTSSTCSAGSSGSTSSGVTKPSRALVAAKPARLTISLAAPNGGA